MKCVVFAYHNIGCVCLQSLLDQGAEVQALFSHQDNPKEEIWFRGPAAIAEREGIPLYLPKDPNQSETIDRIRSLEPDFIFSFYYRRILSNDILKIPRFGALNLHGSLLPKYRGRAPLNWVLVNGEEKTGATLHYMTEKPDAGDIVAQEKVAIDFSDTAMTLSEKLEGASRKLLGENVPLLREGKAPRIPQNEPEATTFPARRPEDGKIHWSRPTSEICNLVRAVTHPYPGAFSTLRGKKWFIWRASPEEGKRSSRPGVIQVGMDGLFVGTGTGFVLIERCQWEGQEELLGIEFSRKENLESGERVGEVDKK